MILLSIPIVLGLLLTGLYFYTNNKADIHKGYQSKIRTGGEIEGTYLQNGVCKARKTTEKVENPIGKYTIYYPEELETSFRKYPMLLVVNGTGGIFYRKIDVENIGITGFSQGGTAVFNVLTNYEEGRYFKAAAMWLPGSAVSSWGINMPQAHLPARRPS